MRTCAVLLLFCAAAAFGESYGWVSSGTRDDNPLVLRTLLESDLDRAGAVVDALAARADGYVEDIIEGLVDQHSTAAASVLAAYLGQVASRDAGPRRAWVNANARTALSLVHRLSALEEPYVRAAVLCFLPDLDSPTRGPALSAALTRIASDLGRLQGHLAGGARAELFAALAAADETALPELAPQLLEIARFSRDPECVKEARRIAADLLREAAPEAK